MDRESIGRLSPNALELMDKSTCSTCGRPIVAEEFTNYEAIFAWRFSTGECQGCQDKKGGQYGH